MAFKITWKPVLQALALRDYHPAYSENTIMVCVNPQSEFWKERADLLEKNARRYAESDPATNTRKKMDPGDVQKMASEYLSWFEQEFVPKANDWFARLWSFGEEQFTVDDLKEYNEIDPHFLVWLKQRSIEMIEEHRQGKKKA